MSSPGSGHVAHIGLIRAMLTETSPRMSTVPAEASSSVANCEITPQLLPAKQRTLSKVLIDPVVTAHRSPRSARTAVSTKPRDHEGPTALDSRLGDLLAAPRASSTLRREARSQ
jgi:hypothetical protein